MAKTTNTGGKKTATLNKVINNASAVDQTTTISQIADAAKVLYDNMVKMEKPADKISKAIAEAGKHLANVTSSQYIKKWNDELERLVKLQKEMAANEEKQSRRDKGLDVLRSGNYKGIFDIKGNSNKVFDNYINKNRGLISANNDKFYNNLTKITELRSKIDSHTLSGTKLADAKAALAGFEAENASLGAETKGLNSKNAKAAAAQAAMNIAIAGVKKVAATITETFSSIAGVSLSIKGNFNSILSGLSQWMGANGIATYSTGTSLITNSAARTQQMKYGLSSSASWAMQNASDMLNIKTDEDLMYMNSSQRQMFSTLMTKYNSWYDQLQSSGVLQSIQETQLDLALFKQEMQMELLQWVSEHKDDIISAAKGIMKITTTVIELLLPLIQGIASAVAWLAGSTVGSGASASSLMSDYYSSSSSVRNSSLTINNTNNVSGFGIDGVAETLGESLGNQYKEAYLALGGNN